MPKSSIKKVITADILQYDHNSVNHIINRIKDDEEAEEFYKQMQTQNALITRQRLLKRHERNIAL